eukprot:1363074-Pyramimonas_sp.AAC.2
MLLANPRIPLEQTGERSLHPPGDQEEIWVGCSFLSTRSAEPGDAEGEGERRSARGKEEDRESSWVNSDRMEAKCG